MMAAAGSGLTQESSGAINTTQRLPSRREVTAPVYTKKVKLGEARFLSEPGLLSRTRLLGQTHGGLEVGRADETLAGLDEALTVRAGLDAAGVAYERAPHLVRGLDYYTGFVFELHHAGTRGQNIFDKQLGTVVSGTPDDSALRITCVRFVGIRSTRDDSDSAGRVARQLQRGGGPGDAATDN